MIMKIFRRNINTIIKIFYFYKMWPLKSMHYMIIIILILTLFIFGMIFSMKFKSSCHCFHNPSYSHPYSYPMYEYNPYNNYNNNHVYGGELDRYRMLFIGTVPIIPSDPTTEGKPSRYLLDWQSNFRNVKAFLSRHPNIDYNFLIYDPNPIEEERKYFMEKATIDPLYRNHIINHNLKNGLPPGIGVFDIVYIDTNTLGFIDTTKTYADWIGFFSPLVSANGCIISDDDQYIISKRPGINGLLGTEVKNGFTGRIIGPTINDPVLNDFMQTVTRHNISTVLLFRVNRPDGKYDIPSGKFENLPEDIKELLILKRTWSL